MNNEYHQKVVASATNETIGYRVAKQYHNWHNLDIVQEHYRARDIVFLAEMIDAAITAKGEER